VGNFPLGSSGIVVKDASSASRVTDLADIASMVDEIVAFIADCTAALPEREVE